MEDSATPKAKALVKPRKEITEQPGRLLSIKAWVVEANASTAQE
jgi:hypothetical protein